MSFQITSSNWLTVLLLISKLFFLADIVGSWIRFFSWRLMFSCVRPVLLPLERSLFRFKLDPSVLYFFTFFQIVISVGETISKALFYELPNLFKASSPKIICGHKNPLFTLSYIYRVLAIRIYLHINGI